MRIDPPAFHAKNTAPFKEPRFVVAIIYDVDSIYITSHDDIEGVPGTVIPNALREPTITSQRLKPDEARAEIGSASFALIDLGAAFTDEVRERLQDGEGLRYRKCRFYLGYAGLDFSDFVLRGTQIISDARNGNGQYSISCLDVQRTLRKDIFTLAGTNLAQSVAASDATISVTSTDGFEMVYHGPSYSDAPNSTVGYIKLKSTIYRYTGKTSTTFTGCTAVFGTVAEAITVDLAVAADRREKVEEYVYLELPAVKLARAILMGDLYGDGAVLPDGWTLAIDDEWLRESDWLGIGPDLWDPADDDAGFPLRFEGLSKQDGLRFLETEVFQPLGVFMPVYADGALGLKRMLRVAPDAAYEVVFDDTNSIQVGDLQHDFASLHNIFEVNWSWNGSQFNRTTSFVDQDSFLVHGAADVDELSFKGLYGGRHTDAAIFQMLDRRRDRYAAPPHNLTVELLHSMNGVEVGGFARCRYRSVSDFTSPQPGANDYALDRTMEIQSVHVDDRTGRVSVSLFGSTASPSISSPTDADTALPDGFYNSEGTALSAAPGITIVGGVITAATMPLSGHAEVTDSGAIYYHDDDLEVGTGVTLSITGNVQLRVRGFLQVNGTIDGTGGGLAGVSDNTDISIPVFGNPGYVGGSRGGDGLSFIRPGPPAGLPTAVKTLSVPMTDGRNPIAPLLNLQIVDDDIAGLPSDLRGTGGGPGGKLYRETTGALISVGGAGARGGAGMVIISRGMAVGASGVIDLSGADSSLPAAVGVSIPGAGNCYPGTGGAGGPGTLYVLLDGANLSVPDLGTNQFRGYTGECALQGEPIVDPDSNRLSLLTFPISGFASPNRISSANLSGAALRIQYIPAVEAVTPDQDSLPPPITNLTATGVVGGIALVASAPPVEQWDVIEFYGAATNDRTGATLVARIRADAYTHGFASATTRYYWARTRKNGRVSGFYPVSSTGGVSATSIDAGSGSPGESVEVEFSVNGSTSWHGTFTAGDLYMRTRVGSSGTWQGPWRIVGEEGEDGVPGADGNIQSFIFRRSATAPSTPTGNSPASWFDAPPAHNGNPLWFSKGLKTPAGGLVGSWSTPQVMAQDGAEGLPGVQGPGLFTWSAGVAVTTTPNSITRSTGGGTDDAGAYSLQSYSGGCFFTARAGELSVKSIGFNPDPATDNHYTGIDVGFRTAVDGTLRATVSGSLVGTAGTYTAASVLSGLYDGTDVLLFKDGTLFHTATGQAGKRFFLDVSLNTANSSWRDVAFGPSGPRGADSSVPGPPAQAMRLSSTAQAFTFNAAGTPAPAGQSISFTANPQNLPGSTVWSTTPSVPLLGSGDTRALSVTDFGGNDAVRVTAAASGFSDSITVVRLSQGAAGVPGQAAVTGYLTNEAHTLVADPDGVVADYSSANGYFRVFEGVTDRTALALFSIVSASGCTAQINTTTDTPVVGQPRGFYRVTAVTSDTANAVLRTSFGGVTTDKVFSVTRARRGQPGDGSNLLRVDDWIVGTTGSQGSPARWLRNGSDAESAIVLGGAGTAPFGPLGTTEPLWECRPDGASNGDGGWDVVNIPVDPGKSYRSVVWFRANQLSGSLYHGLSGESTLNLNGTANTNPYFAGGGWTAYGLEPNQWYMSVGIVHGKDYTGGHSGISGIYDPRTGKRVNATMGDVEFKMAPGATTQGHRAYHYYDPSTSTRQWMARPRFEEINGNEPSIWDLMGIRLPVPWIERGLVVAGATAFQKLRSAVSNWDAAVCSPHGFRSAHVQWKADSTSQYVMMGITSDPFVNDSYETIDYTLYAQLGGAISIYSNGTALGNYGTYTAATEFGVARDEVTGLISFFVDKVRVGPQPSSPDVPYYAKAVLYTPGAGINSVIFGAGARLETIDSGQLAPNVATELYATSCARISGFSPAAGVYSGLNLVRDGSGEAIISAGSTDLFLPGAVKSDCVAIVTGTLTASSTGPVTVVPWCQNLTTGTFEIDAGQEPLVLDSTLRSYTLQGQFNLLRGNQYRIGVRKISTSTSFSEQWEPSLKVLVEIIKK